MIQHLIGTVLLALSIAFGCLVIAAAGSLWIAQRRSIARHSILTTLEYDAATPRQYPLTGDIAALVPTEPLPLSMIVGTIAGMPTLQAPLSGQPCVIWNVTLYHWNRAENCYDSAPVWSHTMIGVLEIPYTRIRHTRFQPHKVSQQTSGGGIFQPSGAVVLDFGFIFPHRSQLAPMTTPYLTYLQQAGVPQEIAGTITADMGIYGVKEQYLTTGDAIRGTQMRQEFMVGPGAQDRSRSAIAGCFVAFLIACSGIGALIGYQLLS
jgi:hypothetical protein